MAPENKQIHIGTSNIVLPITKPHYPPAYRSGSQLAYYASLFDTVEINRSFYKIPQFNTFARWAADVPGNFRFSVKLWRGITHTNNLHFSEVDVAAFLEAAAGLGNKRACLLVQFPASVTIALLPKVEALLRLLAAIDAARAWQIAVEFRHRSWYTPHVYTLLDELECAVVLHDMKGSATPSLNSGAKTAYYRFHGTQPNYTGTYSTEELRAIGKQLRPLLGAGKEIYVYFNNTVGAAFENARDLQEIVK